MVVFQYDTGILEQFPHLVGGVIIAEGITNPPSTDELKAVYLAEQQAIINKIGDTPLSEIRPLFAWRRAFSSFGVNPTKYRSASEALLRRLTKKGDIPSINTLVDIGNLISIRHAVPVAVFDRTEIVGTVTVHFADGSESYIELHGDEVIHPEIGEVVFSDEEKRVIARRWCWRQSRHSAANPETTDTIITIESHHDGGRADIEQAIHELLLLLEKYAGGRFRHAILGSGNPSSVDIIN